MSNRESDQGRPEECAAGVNEKRPVQSGEHTVVILQPSYLPWLGYFAQMHRSNTFVVYDDVQFDKESWRNRNRIKSSDGVQWLTVPVLTKGQNKPSNRDIRINNSVRWAAKHLGTIRQNYVRAANFEDYVSVFERIYAREWEFLIDLNMEFLTSLMTALGLQREIRFASSLGVRGRSVERLVSICRFLGATCFYEGAAGRAYIDERLFEEAGIRLEFQDYRHPVYPQLHGEFVPYLSVVDLLFNCGPKSLETLVQ